jgi:anti-anti-sigma factor
MTSNLRMGATGKEARPMTSKQLGLKPQVEHIGEKTILTFTDGKIWGEENFIARELRVSLPQPSGQCHLFLDFRNVGFLNSSELGTLLCLRKKMHEALGRLTLVNLNPPIVEVFKRTKLNRILDIERAGR